MNRLEGVCLCGAVRWTVARIPIDHFDGLDTFDDLPRDGKCVADYWFQEFLRRRNRCVARSPATCLWHS